MSEFGSHISSPRKDVPGLHARRREDMFYKDYILEKVVRTDSRIRSRSGTRCASIWLLGSVPLLRSVLRSFCLLLETQIQTPYIARTPETVRSSRV